jgi:hypothetical protein
MNILPKLSKTNEVNLRKTNKKIFYIFVLNAIDGILTYIGVSNNYTFEANKLMVSVVSNFNKMLLFKIFIPSLMLALVAYAINKNDSVKMPIARFLINISFLVYTLVLFFHFIWIGMLLYNIL